MLCRHQHCQYFRHRCRRNTHFSILLRQNLPCCHIDKNAIGADQFIRQHFCLLIRNCPQRRLRACAAQCPYCERVQLLQRILKLHGNLAAKPAACHIEAALIGNLWRSRSFQQRSNPFANQQYPRRQHDDCRNHEFAYQFLLLFPAAHLLHTLPSAGTADLPLAFCRSVLPAVLPNQIGIVISICQHRGNLLCTE